MKIYLLKLKKKNGDFTLLNKPLEPYKLPHGEKIFTWINFLDWRFLSFAWIYFLNEECILSCFYSLNEKRMWSSRQKSNFYLYKNSQIYLCGTFRNCPFSGKTQEKVSYIFWSMAKSCKKMRPNFFWNTLR